MIVEIPSAKPKPTPRNGMSKTLNLKTGIASKRKENLTSSSIKDVIPPVSKLTSGIIKRLIKCQSRKCQSKNTKTRAIAPVKNAKNDLCAGFKPMTMDI